MYAVIWGGDYGTPEVYVFNTEGEAVAFAESHTDPDFLEDVGAYDDYVFTIVKVSMYYDIE